MAVNEKHLTDLEITSLWSSDAIQEIQKCLVLAPQLPTNVVWVTPSPEGYDGSYTRDSNTTTVYLKTAWEMLDHIIGQYSIDSTRQYLCGHSSGAYAVWDSLYTYPDRFAAALPVAGGADLATAGLVKDVPIWAVHGSADTIVPSSGSTEMIDAIRAAGGTTNLARITMLNGIDHQSEDEAMSYQQYAIPKWMFSYSNGKMDAVASNRSEVVSQSVGRAMNPGQTASVSVTFKNTGSSTWTTAAGHKLGIYCASNGVWGVTRVALTNDVSSGQTVTFTFNITAPASAGRYDFQLRMVDDAAPNQGWFGQTTPNVCIDVGQQNILVQAEAFMQKTGFGTQYTTDPTGGGMHISNSAVSNDLAYVINVSHAGTYHAVFRYAAVKTVKIDVKKDGATLCSVNEPSSGAYVNWTTSSAYPVTLPAGEVTLTLLAVDGGWNLNWFQLVATNTPPPPPVEPGTVLLAIDLHQGSSNPLPGTPDYFTGWVIGNVATNAAAPTALIKQDIPHFLRRNFCNLLII